MGNRNQMENRRVSNNDEIDLLQLLLEFKKRIVLIIAAAVIGGGLAGAYSVFALTPQYTSTAMMYILSKETTLTSLADLQIGSQLTKDYKILVTSRPVLEKVIETMKLDMNYRELKSKITTNNPADTRILSISVQDTEPERAKEIADKLVEVSAEYIGNIMEMVPPKMVESGEVPTTRTSPSNTKNAMMGAMAGIVLVCGLITLEVLLNDTVRTEEDVARYLGLTVLATVPKREGEKEENKERMAKNKPSKKFGKRGR